MKKCKHKNRIDKNFITDEYGIIEYETYCKDCKIKLGNWSYGYYDFEYCYNYELKWYQKLKIRLEDFYFKIRNKFISKSDNDLPF